MGTQFLDIVLNGRELRSMYTQLWRLSLLYILVMGRLIGIGIEHLQNRAFDRESESESHRKKLSLKFDSYTSILFQFTSK